jgi:phage-related protein (TIGR01555 family)
MWNWFKTKKTPEVTPPKIEEKPREFSTHQNPFFNMQAAADEMLQQKYKDGLEPYNKAGIVAGTAMDNNVNIKLQNQGGSPIPTQQIFWYASQSFIGFQLCAMLSQNWLVKKCCLMPAKDAVRNGYEITVNDGTEVNPEILDAMRKLDVEYRLNYNLIQLVDQGRIFGIRVAMFLVDNDDPEYYFKPFNPDGVTPGSYKGISQIDPYWITPQLDTESAGAPASIHFYEPTWWNVAGRLVHRTHLIVYRTEELPDILKPTYIYGGVSIPQKIYERVYAAERTANEAPLLALTKRLDILKADLPQAVASGPAFAARIQEWVFNRDNYGIKAIGLEEEVNQFDTSLADLDAVIMTQYQLVAAAANVPAVKLLGTAPKGFNSTGEYEEANYHEELESIQTHDLTPMIERHHMLLIRSEICPKFGIEPFSTTVTWKPLDAMTGKELAELNRLKAETGKILVESGAIDGLDERERIIADPESGYAGLEADEVPSLLEENENDRDAAEMGKELV